MTKVELLAPAGNKECLETALYFGADAVYVAGESFGLRAFANNFTADELKKAVAHTHAYGKKIYITVNSVMYSDEIKQLTDYLVYLDELSVDGIIFSDPAVLEIVKKNNLKLPLHLSTQTNTTNHMSAMMWHRLGVERVVLSRELTLQGIHNIRLNTPQALQIEAFVHGAMCIAHSGRCLLSSFFTDRSANRGECVQSCRWKYHLYEEGYEGEYFDISEDTEGTYILNSKDLMMIEHIPEMVQAGISSFKIEGRMKSVYYVASVIGAYRRAMDAYYEHPEKYDLDSNWVDELRKSATRNFTTGFYFGNPREEGQDTKKRVDPRQYTFCAKVLSETSSGYIEVEQRNKFSVGETLEVLSPNHQKKHFVLQSIKNLEGEMQQSAPHPQQQVIINCPISLQKGDLLRRHDG